MGVHWKRQELDLKIMKLLYEHGAVQGKIIVDKLSQASQVKRQKVYDRIKGLKELDIVAGVKYLGITWEEKRMKKKRNPRNLGTLYYLTRHGVQQTKAILYNKEITGNERSFKPEESDIETYWQASQIMSNIDLEFTSARGFKKYHQLQRNFIVDMVYRDWYIVIAKNNRGIYKNLLVQQSRQTEGIGIKNRLILCSSQARLASFMDYFIESHAPETHFLLQNDYDNIKTLLTGRKLDAIIDTIESRYPVEQLQTPEEGYRYKIDNEYANIYSLIGNPVQQIRRLPLELPGYYGVADKNHHKMLEKYFTIYIDKHTPIIAVTINP